MEPLWYLLGFAISALVGAQIRKPFAPSKRGDRTLNTEEKDRIKKQWENLLAYDGNEQEGEDED